MELQLGDWDHELFINLRQLLIRVQGGATAQNLHEFDAKLVAARPWLLRLSNLPGPSDQAKQYIAKNATTTPHGSETTLAGDALAEADFIAQVLGISQRLAATLLVQSTELRSQYPARKDVEIAIYTYLAWVNQMLDFLAELFACTIASTTGDDFEPYEQMVGWVADLLNERVDNVTVADQILSQIDVLHGRINTLLTGQMPGNAQVGHDLLEHIVGTYRAQQDKLAGLLGSICQSGYLSKREFVKLLRYLQKANGDASGLHNMLAMALCSAIRPIETLGAGDERIEKLGNWVQDVQFIKLVGMKELLEQWANPDLRACIKLVWFIFYSTEFHEAAPTGMDLHQIDQHIAEAVFENAFGFLQSVIGTIRRDAGKDIDTRGLPHMQLLATRSTDTNNPFVLSGIQEIIDYLANRKGFCRMLRNKEEDAARKGGGERYQQFMQLIAATYRELPEDAADELWDQTTFTKEVMDIRTNFFSPAAYDMFAAIAKGKSCALKCLEKLKVQRGGWDKIVQVLNHYVGALQVLYDVKGLSNDSKAAEHNGGIPDDDYRFTLAAMRMMAVVTEYSPEARIAFAQIKPPIITILFDLLNRTIRRFEVETYELQVEIFRILTAFVADVDQQTRIIEHYERVTIPIKPPNNNNNNVNRGTTWYARAAERQSQMGRFSLSVAHYKFLSAILSVDPSKAKALQDRAVQQAITDAGPSALLSVPYADYLERDALFSAVFGFIEKALQMLNLEALSPSNTMMADARAISTSPGFAILLGLVNPKRQILDTLRFYFVHLCTERKDANHILLCIVRIFRLLLVHQEALSDYAIETIDKATGRSQSIGTGLQRFDEYLISWPQVVLNVALLVDSPDESIGLVAVKFIQSLASTAMFGAGDRFGNEYHSKVNRLAGLIESSDNSIRIAQGFQRKLEMGGPDMTEDEIEAAATKVLKGQQAEGLGIVTRSIILDMLILGTRDVSEPNMAHFLLGFDFRAPQFGLQRTDDETARVSCLDMILLQLNDYLARQHPILAAKSAQLVYQLFANPAYGRAVIEYATADDFSHAQLTTMPDWPALTDIGHVGEVSYPDNVAQTSTAEAVRSYIAFVQFILSSVALDTFASEGDGQLAESIAQVLFDSWVDREERTREPLMLDLLAIVDMTWVEQPVESKDLQVYINFSFDQYFDNDFYLLEGMERALRQAIPAQARQAAEDEIEYILAQLGQKNRANDIILTKAAFLTTWNASLKVALSMLSKYVDEERLVSALFDLLDGIAKRLVGDVSTGVLNVLSESTLVTIKQLVHVLEAYDGINLPIDRLSMVLRNLVELVSRSGMSEAARGNLYASINLYLSLLSPAAVADIPDDVSVMTSRTTAPLAPSLHRESLAVIDSRKDRFFGTLCRDAMEDTDVWKTECYSLLGALVSVCRNERDRAVLAPLTKAGYLTVIVRSIKDQEMPLIETLSPSPSNLHAYWVFEAKLAFLLSVASTRKGAEQLVNAGIFETLSTCAFVHAQVLTQEVLANYAHCEVVMRQHLTLIWVLQLVARVLSSLGTTSRGAVSQAISLLNAHGEALLLILRESQNGITLTGLEEMKLIVAILGMVASSVLSEELASRSGLGAFHHAILSASARFFNESEWQANLVTEEKELDQAVPEVLQLNHAILLYLCTATSGLKPGHGQPVLVTGAQRAAVGSAKYITSAPSLQDAVDLAHAYGEQVAQVAKDYDFVLDRQEAGMTVITAQEVEGMSSVVLDAGEYGTEEAMRVLMAHSHMLYNMVESLLLLLWRHMLFYANESVDGGVQPRNLSSSLAYSQGLCGTRAASRQTLSNVAASLGGTLDAIERQVPDELRSGGEQGRRYHGMLVRRLREMIGGLTDG